MSSHLCARADIAKGRADESERASERARERKRGFFYLARMSLIASEHQFPAGELGSDKLERARRPESSEES